jgi:hypothetical protein
MEIRLNKLEEKITILEEKVNSVGILTPSKKQFIPQVPFRLEEIVGIIRQGIKVLME